MSYPSIQRISQKSVGAFIFYDFLKLYTLILVYMRSLFYHTYKERTVSCLYGQTHARVQVLVKRFFGKYKCYLSSKINYFDIKAI